jgi:hypothetical protein
MPHNSKHRVGVKMDKKYIAKKKKKTQIKKRKYTAKKKS